VRALDDRLVLLSGKSREHVDWVIYRENTEGEYAGGGFERDRDMPDEIAVSREVHTRRGVERLLRAAFERARVERRPLTVTHKANAISAQGLWARSFAALKGEYTDVTARALYVDALAARLVQAPEEHSIIAASNLQGDILSDLCAALAGGLGLAPSANLHPAEPNHIGLFEPVHGSAPDIAGRGIANPLGAIRSLGLLVGHLGRIDLQSRIELATVEVLRSRRCTPDLGGDLGTSGAGAAFREVFRYL